MLYHGQNHFSYAICNINNIRIKVEQFIWRNFAKRKNKLQINDLFIKNISNERKYSPTILLLIILIIPPT